MNTQPQPLECKLTREAIIINNDLKISFRRTIRVPDNHQASELPPDLGAFPLKSVNKHMGKMCASMAAKGGLFFPMHRKWAPHRNR